MLPKFVGTYLRVGVSAFLSRISCSFSSIRHVKILVPTHNGMPKKN